MKKIIITISIILVLVALALAFSTPKAGSLLDSKDFILKYKNTPNAVLIDVRTPVEFEGGHIPNAINIDYENVSFENEIKKLDTTKTYFVYCRSGNRSSRSMVIMKNNGIKNIYDLQGGISIAPELLK